MRLPPSARSGPLAVLGGELAQGGEPAGAWPARPGSRLCPCASSASASSSTPVGGGMRRHRQHRHLAGSHGAHRLLEVAPRAVGGRSEVGLGHHEHVRHLHDARLEELEHVAGSRLNHDRHGVADLLHVGLRLSHAHGLDHNHVEGGRQRLGGLASGRGQSAEARRPRRWTGSARRRRADRARCGHGRRGARRPSASRTGPRRARRRCARARARPGRGTRAARTCPHRAVR